MTLRDELLPLTLNHERGIKCTVTPGWAQPGAHNRSKDEAGLVYVSAENQSLTIVRKGGRRIFIKLLAGLLLLCLLPAIGHAQDTQPYLSAWNLDTSITTITSDQGTGHYLHVAVDYHAEIGAWVWCTVKTTSGDVWPVIPCTVAADGPYVPGTWSLYSHTADLSVAPDEVLSVSLTFSNWDDSVTVTVTDHTVE